LGLYPAFPSPLPLPLPYQQQQQQQLRTPLLRIPLILAYVWSHLLIFNIANQRLPSFILEDQINKPSRPLPSGLITPSQTRRLLLILIPLVLAFSYILGPWQEALLLLVSTWMYNDLGGGNDEGWVLRNFLIAMGYGLYSSAALRIAGCSSSDGDEQLTTQGVLWVGVMMAMILTTQHVADVKDRVGDAARGRRSAPIVLGDGVVRWTIAVPVLFWSGICPSLFFNQLGVAGFVAPVVLGIVVAGRLMLWRDVEDDKTTWKLWALWTVVLFSLPCGGLGHCLMALKDIVGQFSLWSDVSEPLSLVGVSSVVMLVESRRLHGYAADILSFGNRTSV
jgi:4-hydroxybenzoate polyprenyltransferase